MTALDIRAGAFASMKVNTSWWAEDIKSIIENYYYEDKTLEEWEWKNEYAEEAFWELWNDLLQSFLTKVLMGHLKYDDIIFEFREYVITNLDNGYIIPLWEEEEEEEEEKIIDSAIEFFTTVTEKEKPKKKIKIVKKKKN